MCDVLISCGHEFLQTLYNFQQWTKHSKHSIAVVQIKAVKNMLGAGKKLHWSGDEL